MKGLALAVAVLIAVLSVLPAWAGVKSESFPTEVIADVAHPGIAANPVLLRNNIQWVDRGDGLLAPPYSEFNQARLNTIRDLSVTLRRYPGGLLADLYRWRQGGGDVAQRGLSEQYFSGQKQKILMRTRELLDLCQAIGAAPLITGNVITALASDLRLYLGQSVRKIRRGTYRSIEGEGPFTSGEGDAIAVRRCLRESKRWPQRMQFRPHSLVLIDVELAPQQGPAIKGESH